MKFDAKIAVRFYLPVEGGRAGPILGGVFGCPMLIDGVAFDCRLYFKEPRLELGRDYEVAVRFLQSHQVVPRLRIGTKIVLWEGKDIGAGRVVSL